MIQAPMDLMQCSSCGQKALRVATRCPRCGHDLASEKLAFEREHKRAHFQLPITPQMAGIGLLVVLVMAIAALNWAGAELAPATSEIVAPPPESVQVAVRPPIVQTEPVPEPASIPNTSDRTAQAGDLEAGATAVAGEAATEEAHLEPGAASADPLPAETPLEMKPAFRSEPRGAGGDFRWTSTWVNVRERRGVSAPIVAVLDPGQRVEIQRPFQGWSLVVVDGQALGYVYSRFLASRPVSD